MPDWFAYFCSWICFRCLIWPYVCYVILLCSVKHKLILFCKELRQCESTGTGEEPGKYYIQSKFPYCRNRISVLQKVWASQWWWKKEPHGTSFRPEMVACWWQLGWDFSEQRHDSWASSILLLVEKSKNLKCPVFECRGAIPCRESDHLTWWHLSCSHKLNEIYPKLL